MSYGLRYLSYQRGQIWFDKGKTDIKEVGDTMKNRALKTLVFCAGVSTLLVLCGTAWGNLKSGLVAYWTFDEGGGTIAHDSAGNNDGTIHGNATWTIGHIDNALELDGFDDYVSVQNSLALNITGDITISAWVCFGRGGTGQNGSEQAIVTKCVSNGARNNPFDFRTDKSTEPQLTLVRADPFEHDYVYSTKHISIMEWHHVVAIVENNIPDFYVDGVITGKTVAAFTRTPTGNTNPLLIGRRDDGLYFNGKIDDVRIYNRALTEQEIWQLYTIPEPATLFLLGSGTFTLLRRRRAP